jgi:hypothetical protein
MVRVIRPIFEADLPPEQYAYRPERNAHDAIRQVHSLLNMGHTQVVDADLAAFYDTIPHAELMKSVARRIVDRHGDEKRGIPQGSPLSPLLANLYMRRFVLGGSGRVLKGAFARASSPTRTIWSSAARLGGASPRGHAVLDGSDQADGERGEDPSLSRAS